MSDISYEAGRARHGSRCPICGASGACTDVTPAPMPLPPFDIGDCVTPEPAVRLYAVTVNGYPTVLHLSDTEAAHYGAAAVPIQPEA